MKQFIVRGIQFCIPLFCLAVIYMITDVFKVIYHYDPFYTDSYYIGVNRAYGSTMTYINQNPQYNYDSFIFGNSRSLFFEIDTWKKYLPEDSRCIHFDESIGAIRGVRDKIAFVDKNGGCLNNVMLVVDHILLSSLELNNGYLYITPPILKDYSNFISFHFQHFGAFMNPKFLAALADYNLFGQYRPYMQGLISDEHSTYIAEYNEFQMTKTEEEIKRGTYYDDARMKAFENVQEPGTLSKEVLTTEEIACLRDIRSIFDKHQTSYKIVISPMYDQIKLNRTTYKTLCNIFGKDHVYDFSGVNKWNKDYHNYYEESHFRPHVSAEVMEMIYTKQ